MMVKVINLVSVKTHSKRADLLKKNIYISFSSKQKKKITFHAHFHMKMLSFQNVLPFKTAASPEILFLYHP